MARSKTKARPKGRVPSLIQIYIARNGSTEVTQSRGQPTFPAHSAGRKNLRRTKCAAEVLSCPRTREVGCPRAGHTRQLMRRCKPSCAYPRQHRTEYQSGSREASSSQDRSRCSQPGRSRSHRHRRPCCRSRPPGDDGSGAAQAAFHKGAGLDLGPLDGTLVDGHARSSAT